MQITLAAVGRMKAGPEKDLFDHYAARLRWPFAVREVEEKKKLPPNQLKDREAELTPYQKEKLLKGRTW